MKRYVLAVMLALSLAGCAKTVPPNLTPAQTTMYQINASDVIVALGTAQHAAIELNKLQDCFVPSDCHRVLSDANTRIVIDAVSAALNTIKAAPLGWKAAAAAALMNINAQLDAAGKSKLAAYLAVIQTVAGL